MLLRLPIELTRKILVFVIVSRYGCNIQYTCKELYIEYRFMRCRFEPLAARTIPNNLLVVANLRCMRLFKYGRFKVPDFTHFCRLSVLVIDIEHHSHWGVLKNLPESLINLTLCVKKRFRYSSIISEIVPIPSISIRFLKVISKHLVRIKAFRLYHLVQQREFLEVNNSTRGHDRCFGVLISWLLRTYRRSLILFQVQNIDLDLVFSRNVSIELPQLRLMMFDNTSLVRLDHWLQVFNRANFRTSNPLFILMVDNITRTIYTSTSNNTGNWSNVPYTRREVIRVLNYLNVY